MKFNYCTALSLIIVSVSCLDSVMANADQPAPKLYRVENTDGTRFGYIDENGTLVVPFIYEQAGGFYDGMAAVAKVKLNGFLNDAGVLAIPFQYEDVLPFSESAAAVKMDGKWGFIDKNGAWIAKPFAQEVDSFSCGMAAVKVDDGWTFLLASTHKMLPERYEAVVGASEGLAAVTINGLCGFIDNTGKMRIPPQFKDVDSFSCGRARVINGDKTQFINQEGVVVIENLPKNTGMFCDGFALTGDGDVKDKLIDTTGKVVLDPHLEGLEIPGEGLIAAKSKGLWGYIDIASGKWIIPPEYGEAAPFKKGLATVFSATGRCGVIDRFGKTIVPFEYSFVGNFDGSLVLLR